MILIIYNYRIIPPLWMYVCQKSSPFSSCPPSWGLNLRWVVWIRQLCLHKELELVIVGDLLHGSKFQVFKATFSGFAAESGHPIVLGYVLTHSRFLNYLDAQPSWTHKEVEGQQGKFECESKLNQSGCPISTNNLMSLVVDNPSTV